LGVYVRVTMNQTDNLAPASLVA